MQPSIVQPLCTQAERIRMPRRLAAEAAANETRGKLLVPPIRFILLCIVIVMPAVLRLVSALTSPL